MDLIIALSVQLEVVTLHCISTLLPDIAAWKVTGVVLPRSAVEVSVNSMFVPSHTAITVPALMFVELAMLYSKNTALYSALGNWYTVWKFALDANIDLMVVFRAGA